MSKWFRVILFFGVVAACQAERIKTAGVMIQTLPVLADDQTLCHGQSEQRIRMKNTNEKDVEARLVINGNGSSRWNPSLRSLSRSVVIPAGTTRDVSFWEPPIGMDNAQIQVIVPGQKKTEYLGFRGGRYSFQGAALQVLVSEQLNRDSIRDRFEKLTSSASGGGYYGSPVVEFTRSGTPVQRWSANSMAYTGVDLMMISEKEMEQMPSAVRSAVNEWVLLGGQLVVLGRNKNYPENWPRGQVRKDSDITDHSVGFGGILAVGSDPETWTDSVVKQIKSSAENASKPYGNSGGMSDLNRYLRLVDNLNIPLRGFLLLMILYAVGVGPVQIIWLAKKNKRIWMLWLTPLISLSVCVVVVVWSLFSEGITASARFDAMTVLNQKQHQAITISRQGYYSPFAPSEGLSFANNVDWYPMMQHSNFPSGCTVRQGDRQQLTGGWLLSRVPAFFHCRSLDTSRLRLQVLRKPDGSLYVINGLKSKISTLRLCDAEGDFYEAANIDPGASCDLSSTGKNCGKVFWSGSLMFRREWSDWTKMGTAALIPDSYMAKLDEAVFVESALPKANVESSQLVLGFFEEQNDAR